MRPIEYMGKCKICGSSGTNASSCPDNPFALSPKPEKHPLSKGAPPTAVLSPRAAPASSRKTPSSPKAAPASPAVLAIPGVPDKIQETLRRVGIGLPEIQMMLYQLGIYDKPEDVPDLYTTIQPMLITKLLSKSAGKMIEPKHHLRTIPGFMAQWSINTRNIIDDLPTIIQVYKSLPLTKSIKHILVSSLADKSYLKTSSLVNQAPYAHYDDVRQQYIDNELPLPLNYNHDLMAIVAMTDECQYVGRLSFRNEGTSVMGNQDAIPLVFDHGETLPLVTKFREVLRGLNPNCPHIMYLHIPGHAMLLGIKGRKIYIYDTNDSMRYPDWNAYWLGRAGMDGSSVDPEFTKRVKAFFDLLIGTGDFDTVHINNIFNPGTVPAYVRHIERADLCPNFQGRTYPLRKDITYDGTPMFPRGFCLPWSYLVQSMHLTYGAEADRMLKALIDDMGLYIPILMLYPHHDPNMIIDKILLLMIHSISVYLSEITVSRLEDLI